MGCLITLLLVQMHISFEMLIKYFQELALKIMASIFVKYILQKIVLSKVAESIRHTY
jgi:hypothetical protein